MHIQVNLEWISTKKREREWVRQREKQIVCFNPVMQKTKKIVSLFMHAKSFVDNLIITPFQNATSRLGFYIISKFYLQLVLSISKEFNVCKIPGYTDFWIFMNVIFLLYLVKKSYGHFYDIFNHVTCILWCQEENLS